MSSNSLLLERIVPAILTQTQQEAKVILQETRPHKQSYFRAKVERWAWEQTHHLFLYSLWPKNGFYVLKLLRKLKRRIFCDMWKSYGIHPSVSTNRVLLGHSHAHSLLSLVAASAPLLVVTKIDLQQHFIHLWVWEAYPRETTPHPIPWRRRKYSFYSKWSFYPLQTQCPIKPRFSLNPGFPENMLITTLS